MVRILRPQWTNPIPVDRRTESPVVYLSAPEPEIYVYRAPGGGVEIALHEHVIGNPPPAVRSVQGLPTWLMQDGTFVVGTVPNDETETISFEVEAEN